MNNRMAASNDIYVIYEKHVPHVSQPLPRLAFLRDTCTRQHVACVAHVAHTEHMRRVQSKISLHVSDVSANVSAM